MEDSRSEVDLETLVEAHSSLLFRVAYSILRSRAEAEDTVQDVFVRVLERRRSLSNVRDMRVWLVRIVWNLALDRRRRVKPEQLDESFVNSLVALEVSADHALDRAQQVRAVLCELERLPKMERQALLLSAIHELSTPSVAKIMGKSESSIRALLFRARTRLRNRLERGRG